MTSRQVCWFEVHQYVQRRLVRGVSWPTAGTPAWCALDDADPAKLAAVLVSGAHWALRLDTLGQELAEASHDISANTENWNAQARRIINHDSRIERRRAS